MAWHPEAENKSLATDVYEAPSHNQQGTADLSSIMQYHELGKHVEFLREI